MKSRSVRFPFAGALGIGLVPVAGAAKPFDACRTSTNVAYDSCTAGAQSDKALAVGKCDNLLDSGAIKTSMREGSSSTSGIVRRRSRWSASRDHHEGTSGGR